MQLGRRQRVSQQQHLARRHRPQHFHQLLGQEPVGGEADLGQRHAEARLLARHDDIAMQRQLVAAGDRIALDDGDHRERAQLDRAEHDLDPAGLAVADRLAALRHVEAGAEDMALAADDHDAIVRRDRRLQRLDHLAHEFAVERVALFGPVHPDGFDRPALLDDDLGHGVHSGSMPAAWISLVHHAVSLFT
jgi:hypothetical protein